MIKDIVYFGLPLMNVESAVVYTPMQAKQISADALNLAEADMRKKYKANPALSSYQLASYWLQRMDIQMKSMTQNRGKVDNHGSINSTTIPPIKDYAPCN